MSGMERLPPAGVAHKTSVTFCGRFPHSPTAPVTPAPPLVRTVPPLTQAVLRRDLAQLRRLLDAGEDPNQKDDQGFSPWMWATNFEENDALALLLDKTSAIPVTDVSGRRRLAMAASLNNLVAARALLAK